MSQRSLRSQKRASQVLDSTQDDLDDIAVPSQSQSKKQVNVEGQAIQIVRYFLYKTNENTCVKRVDLQKNVIPNSGSHFQAIIRRANEILQEVYGLKLCCLDNTETATGKWYVLTNTLPTLEESKEPYNKLLLLFVLTHIFMSGKVPVTIQSIYSFLAALHIDSSKRHDETWGDVKNYIENVLIKQKYLHKEVDEDTKEAVYLWGPRAEKTVSKMQILEFACEQFKIPAKSWSHHFKEARAQSLDLNK